MTTKYLLPIVAGYFIFSSISIAGVLSQSQRSSRQFSGTNATVIVQEAADRILNKTDSSQCGKVYNQPQFLIESPNYPSNYPPNLECSYVLLGQNCPTTYEFKFLDFFLEQSLGCASDRLEVQNLDALCGTKVGSKTYETKDGVLQLKLVTDGLNSGRGFRILVSRNICVPRYSPTTTTSTTTTAAPPDQTKTRNGVLPHRGDIPDTATGSDSYYPQKPPCPDDDPGYSYDPPVNIPGAVFPFAPSHPIFPNHNHNHHNHNPLPPSPPPTSSQCCATSYSDKRFFVASPAFPYSNNHPTDCLIHINRAHDNICRLRINFHFFLLGTGDPRRGWCPDGHLEIDGKSLCGCRTGMKLISPFDGRLGNKKVLRYHNVGSPRAPFSGFALEVVQDDCPKRYSPSDNITTLGGGSAPEKFSIALTPDSSNESGKRNPIAWPLELVSNTSELELVKEAALISEQVEQNVQRNGDRVIKSVYFFDYDIVNNDYDAGDVSTKHSNQPRDVEDSAYVDTQDIGHTAPGASGDDPSSQSGAVGGDDDRKCRQWGLLQWTLLTRDVLWQRMKKCDGGSGSDGGGVGGEGCKELQFVKGFFQSPGYPVAYPPNLKLCYRFVKQPGYCKLKLIFMDFDLEDSFDCSKDYVKYETYRYCGKRLFNTVSYIDISRRPYDEIRMVSDSQLSGRGFRGVYEQLPCSPYADVPPTTQAPITYLPPVATTTTSPYYPPQPQPQPPGPSGCERHIGEPVFNIGVYDFGTRLCKFYVHKSSAVSSHSGYADSYVNHHTRKPGHGWFESGVQHGHGSSSWFSDNGVWTHSSGPVLHIDIPLPVDY